MENLDQLTNGELSDLTDETTDKKILHAVADHIGVTYSGNSGVETLKTKIQGELGNRIEAAEEEDTDEEDPIMAALKNHRDDPSVDKSDIYVKQNEGQKLSKQFSNAEMMEMDASKIKDDVLRRNVIRAQALRLIRVKISNLDPSDANVPGAIVTGYSKYTGKVARFVPYDEDQHPNGYHIEQMILDDLKTRTFNLRKEIKSAGSSFGVKQYKNTKVKKFSIEILDPLTPAEIQNLANKQQAQGSIDRTN